MPHDLDAQGFVRIGVLARVLNRSPVTLRRWERLGWLPPPRRSISHSVRGERRCYSPEEVDALRGAALHSGILYLEDNEADYETFTQLAHRALAGGADPALR